MQFFMYFCRFVQGFFEFFELFIWIFHPSSQGPGPGPGPAKKDGTPPPGPAKKAWRLLLVGLRRRMQKFNKRPKNTIKQI